jgi:iron(III) transport system ATP-binding protein
MPHQLSGGQQQRVAVARALAPRPPLVLLDEPFSALDAALRVDVRRDVRDALRADGATAVLVTHDQGEALSMADQVAVMRDGVIVQSGPPNEVYAAPADAWVASFVGEAVLLPARGVDGGVARTALGDVPVGSGVAGQATVLLRPEQVEVRPVNGTAGVRATVVRRDYHGHDSLVTLRLTDGTEVVARLLGTEPGVILDAEVSLRVRGPGRLVGDHGPA